MRTRADKAKRGAGRVVRLAIAALAVAACSDSGPLHDITDTGTTAPTGGAATAASRAATETYGYGPSPAPGVVYQPDVVMIGAGPAAVRAASDDGMVWTLLKSAPGVGSLKVGSVVVATSRATGRVVSIVEQGDARVVTLAPVALTDIIRQGSITIKQGLDAKAFRSQPIPNQPGALSRPDAADAPATTRGAKLRADRQGADGEAASAMPVAFLQAGGAATGGGLLQPAGSGSLEIALGPWKVTPSYAANKLALNLSRDGSLKVGVDFAFDVSNLTIDAGANVDQGLLAGSRFVVNGITGLTVSLSAGAAGGSLDNDKAKIVVPVETNIPVPPSPATAGLPLNIKVKFSLVIETALTGNNSTLVGTGKYRLSGPIGFADGKVQAPELAVEQSLLNSLTGITLGPSGMVLAVKMEVQAGLGVAAATAGPFGYITTSIGVTNGSSLGAPLARCVSGTLDVSIGGGAEISLSGSVADALKTLLGTFADIPEPKIEASATVLSRAEVVPDVPLCRGG